MHLRLIIGHDMLSAATIVNGDTARFGRSLHKETTPMNRNLFSDTIALRANAIAAAVES